MTLDEDASIEDRLLEVQNKIVFVKDSAKAMGESESRPSEIWCLGLAGVCEEIEDMIMDILEQVGKPKEPESEA